MCSVASARADSPAPDAAPTPDAAPAPAPGLQHAPDAVPTEANSPAAPPQATERVEESVEEPKPYPGRAAPWLQGWLDPPAPDPNPILATGHTASLQASGGALLSRFSTMPMLSLTADYGWFFASTKRQAWSVQAVGTANVVFDRVTPQFGSIGVGARRVGRRSGTRFGSVDFERLSTGVAFMSRGSDLDLGLVVELAGGVLTFAGTGLGVFIDAYFFEPTNMAGPETLFTVGVGYVYSPAIGLRKSVPSTRKVSAPPSNAGGRECAQATTYREALARERKSAVEACNAEDAKRCDATRARVRALNTALGACEQGQNVGPPAEVDDAPVP